MRVPSQRCLPPRGCDPVHGLRDLRVIDLSTGIAGGYATKLLLRRGRRRGEGGAAGRRPAAAVHGERARTSRGRDGAAVPVPRRRQALGGRRARRAARRGARRATHTSSSSRSTPTCSAPRSASPSDPGLVVLSITPFGRTGPYAGPPGDRVHGPGRVRLDRDARARRAAADQGRRAHHRVGRRHVRRGGRARGGAPRARARARRARRLLAARGDEHRGHDCHRPAATACSAGRTSRARRRAAIELPSIEPTRDGWVGFSTNSRQQFRDFLLLIERPDLLDDEELARIAGRRARIDEWNAIVHAWTTQHTTAEIVERAALLRIPVAPVNDGRSVREHEQFAARGVLAEEPAGRLRAAAPAVSDRRRGSRAAASDAAPRRAHADAIERRAHARAVAAPARQPATHCRSPGIRVLDATAWWAGPSATAMLAALGADVIHVEAIQRPDGMRMVGGALIATCRRWWEASPFFLAANTNKRGLTLDLADPRGLALAKRLIAACDVFVENFTPRVLEQFGLDWESMHALSTRARSWCACRRSVCPARGATTPASRRRWSRSPGSRGSPGIRTTSRASSAGPCDPLAGMHAAFAMLVALAERERTGRGLLVECTMVEAALNAAAEQIVEYGAHGVVLQREGNRAPHAAPQGLYACRGARAVARALGRERRAVAARWSSVLGAPGVGALARSRAPRGRRAQHDRLDAELARWAAERELEPTVAELLARGVPAAPVVDPRTQPSPPAARRARLLRGRRAPGRGHAPDAARRRSASRASSAGSAAPRRRSASTTARSSAACSACPTPRSTSSRPPA